MGRGLGFGHARGFSVPQPFQRSARSLAGWTATLGQDLLKGLLDGGDGGVVVSVAQGHGPPASTARALSGLEPPPAHSTPRPFCFSFLAWNVGGFLFLPRNDAIAVTLQAKFSAKKREGGVVPVL